MTDGRESKHEGGTVRKSIRLPKKMADDITKYSKKHECTFTDAIIRLLNRFFN